MNQKNPYVIDFREEMSAINRKMRLLFEAQSEVILGLPFAKSGSKILVLGAKGGAFTNQIKVNLPECDVYGVEALADLITVAKASYPEVNWQYSPLNKIEYEDGFFDVVFVTHVFTYLKTEEDIYDVLKEVYRVTKEKGQFIVLESDNNSYRGSEILEDLVSSYGVARGGTFYATRIIERNLGELGFALKSADKVVFNNKTYSEVPEVSVNVVSMDRMSALGLLVYMGYRSQTSNLYRTFENEYLMGSIHFELDYRVLITEKVTLTKEKHDRVYATLGKVTAMEQKELVTVHSFSEGKDPLEARQDPLISIVHLDSVKKATIPEVGIFEELSAEVEKDRQKAFLPFARVSEDVESAVVTRVLEEKTETISPLVEQKIEKKVKPAVSSIEAELLGEVTKVVQKKKETLRVKRIEDLNQDLEEVDNTTIKEVGRMLYSSIRGMKLKVIFVSCVLMTTIQGLVMGLQLYFAGTTANPKRDFLLMPFILLSGLGISWASYINLVIRQRSKQSMIEMLALFTLMLTLLMAILPISSSKTFYIFFLNAWLIMIPITFAGIANGRAILGFVYMGLLGTIVYQASIKFGLDYVYRPDWGGAIPLLSCLVILIGNTLIPFSMLFFESGVMSALTQKIPLVIQRLAEIGKGQKDLELENTRMSHELSAATAIQEAGVPNFKELSQLTLCKVAARMTPATEVGGDYYDVMEVDGTTVIGVGDVTDHGLKSGMVMLMAQSVLRSLLEVEKKGLKASLRIVNTLLYKNVQERMEDQRNMTLLVSRIEPGKLTICGQHESVLIYRMATGEVEEIDTETLGFPVGLVEDITDSLKEISVGLEYGDTVLFYTDGIVEAENEEGQYFGLPLLCDIFKKHGSKEVDVVLEGIFEDFKSFVGKAIVYDDATAVVCRLG